MVILVVVNGVGFMFFRYWLIDNVCVDSFRYVVVV